MREAFSLFFHKLKCWSSFKLDYQVFADTLKSCAAKADVNLGKALHSHVIKQGHVSCQIVSKALLNMYAKCKALDDCEKLFWEIKNCDTVMWNIILSGFAGTRVHDTEAVRLFCDMHAAQELKLSTVTLAIILPVCTRYGGLSVGGCVHCYAKKAGLDSDTLVGNALVSMYAKLGLVMDAFAVFDGIVEKDVISWNAIIAGLMENHSVDDAFEMFQWMLRLKVPPNYATIVNVLPLCAHLEDTVGHWVGRQIHSYVLRRAELATEITVVNALLSFYLRIGQMEDAVTLFKRMKFRDLVSWNSIISGYDSCGQWLKAQELFHELVDMDVMGPDPITIVSVLPACGQLSDLQAGKQIHGYVVRHSLLCKDTSVQNALIRFYSNCGCKEAALNVFLLISRKDLISWNSILDALSENKYETQFIDLLHCLLSEGMRLDFITMLTVIQFFTTLSRIEKVREAHGFSIKYGILLGNKEPTLANALLDAYAKCGNLEYAYRIFEHMSGQKNLVTYNSMISGYAEFGSHEDAALIFQSMSERDLTTWNLMVRVYAENDCPSQAVSLFHKMQFCGVKPDSMSIMSLLPVCAKLASVNMLRQCHGYVIRACFADVHLKGALLDIYSKCGNIKSAYNLFQSASEKDLVLFTSMIGGYAMHGMGEGAVGAYYQMLESGLRPDNVIITTVLSACSHTGLVDEGLKIFESMQLVHHMKPSMEQYACLVDLLARGGRIKEAYSFATKMPIKANANVWGALLGACKIHNEVEMARSVVDRLSEIDSSDIGNYIAMSNLYASNSSWENVLKMRKLMRLRDLKKPAGCSWIEVENRKNEFLAGDYSHPHRCVIYETLGILDHQIREFYEFIS
ncbi:putative pentatricopeptide repeat-containing protein At5g08490 [Coffea eugenioides]|uniref:putative pentatricopeptide repeat-containing protein At5g08490 n=1 Tax=Coffea eugenioides TaxID=49369 RepID=UPI000F605DE2|nr:putative pentatricopeptide repeat-containing protein At5g08490 [Coffea eugenioides]